MNTTHTEYNSQDLYEKNIEENTPYDLLILKEIEQGIEEDYPNNEYREASKIFLRVMRISIDYIIRSKSPKLAAVSVAYALGFFDSMEGKSMRQVAKEMKVSCQAISKRALTLKSIFNL